MLSGEKMKFLRYTHNITQVQMAEWCDMSERYVGMIEKNEYKPSDEIYQAWLNCCYGQGEPIKREIKKGAKKAVPTATKKK